MFSWLGVLKGVLSLVNRIAGIVKDKQLMDAGESRQIAKSLAEIQVALGIASDVAREVSALTPEQVDDELENLGAFD